MKFLEENMKKDLDVGLGNDLKDKQQNQKQVGIHQTKSFFTSKEIINKAKKQI